MTVSPMCVTMSPVCVTVVLTTIMSVAVSAVCVTVILFRVIMTMTMTHYSFNVVVVNSFLIQSKIFLRLISCSGPLESRVRFIMATVSMAVMIVCMAVVTVCVAMVPGQNQGQDEEEGQ